MERRLRPWHVVAGLLALNLALVGAALLVPAEPAGCDGAEPCGGGRASWLPMASLSAVFLATALAVMLALRTPPAGA